MPGPFSPTLASYHTATAPPWTPPQQASLAVWLPLETDMDDISGNGRAFTPVGSPTYPTDPDDPTKTVLDLNGSSQYGVLTSHTGLLGGTEVSYGAWIRPRTFGGGGYGRVLSERQGNSSIECNLDDTAANNGATCGYYSNTTNNLVDAPDNTVIVNQWIHLFFTRTNGSSILYADGVQIASNTAGYSTLNGADNDNIYLGDRYDFVRRFNGYMAHIMWWKDVVLTPAEVLDVYQNSRG